MRAITVLPGTAGSGRLDEVPEPALDEGALLVRTLALGVCGTDREILAAEYGSAPPGAQRLILGHESLGLIEQAPPGCGFAIGEHVVGIVRRPDPVPCACCASGEWDMCRNGAYTERGIKERHGFGAERFRLEPEFAVKVDKRLGLAAVLLEPASVVAKAWMHADAIAQRARCAAPRRLLVTGAGPVGLLAALLGVQRGLELHVFNRSASPSKVELTQMLGGRYHGGDIAEVLAQVQPDIVMECTGAVPVIAALLGHAAPNGIVCLLGVTATGRMAELDLGQINRNIVLENQVVFGSVNANRAHYEAAGDALAAADRNFLDRLITRRVPLARWSEALENRPDDIKVVVDFTQK
jgi:threonine dehydrogenase-like Zn-dependent dehydrogenase